MERLWSPWRMTYVGGNKQPDCVFCNALTAADDRGRWSFTEARMRS